MKYQMFAAMSLVACMASAETIEGVYEHLHIDYDGGRGVDEHYVVEKGSGKRIQLLLEGDPEAATSDEVVVEGQMTGKGLKVKKGKVKVTKPAKGRGKGLDKKSESEFFREAFAAEPKRLLVILVNWQDVPTQPFSVTTTKNAFFLGKASAHNYYMENSFGKIGFAGDVVGWYTLPYNRGTIGCAADQWHRDAMAVAKTNGYDSANYDFIAVAYPRQKACNYAGMGSIGGSPAKAWFNGVIGTRIVLHEIGHNLGAHHAGLWICKEAGVPVPISADANCKFSEYGDSHTVMGNANSFHWHGYNKGLNSFWSANTNWLQPSNTLTVDPMVDASYEIAPIETPTAGVQVLRIPRVKYLGLITSYYYVEFRQRIGLDQFHVDSTVPKGVLIRLAPDYNKLEMTKLIDMAPYTSHGGDSALVVGKTFSDPATKINITTQSVDPQKAVVRVWTGDPPCTCP